MAIMVPTVKPEWPRKRGDILGKGAFGKVYRTRITPPDLPPFDVAEKVVDCAVNGVTTAVAQREVQILFALHHPNIVRYQGSFSNPQNKNQILIFMELADSSLHQMLLAAFTKKNLSIDLLRKIVCDIASGLQYLHSNNVMHRDIKPANILIKNDTAKLADFGISKDISNSIGRSGVGTPGFAAPEVGYGEYTAKADIFSFGVTIRVMRMCVSGGTPTVLNRLDDLIENCLRVKPEQRFDILQVLRHNFFAEG